MKIRIDIEKLKLNGVLGLSVLSLLIVICVALSFTLLNSPHKQLHSKLFEMADKTRNYYRDRPGYWNLSTTSAKEDGLFSADLQTYKDYDIQIGQGINGDMSLPSDSSFDISLKHLNKSACISLAEMPLSEENRLSLIQITIHNENTETVFSWGSENSLPMKKYS